MKSRIHHLERLLSIDVLRAQKVRADEMTEAELTAIVQGCQPWEVDDYPELTDEELCRLAGIAPPTKEEDEKFIETLQRTIAEL